MVTVLGADAGEDPDKDKKGNIIKWLLSQEVHVCQLHHSLTAAVWKEDSVICFSACSLERNKRWFILNQLCMIYEFQIITRPCWFWIWCLSVWRVINLIRFELRLFLSLWIQCHLLGFKLAFAYLHVDVINSPLKVTHVTTDCMMDP